MTRFPKTNQLKTFDKSPQDFVRNNINNISSNKLSVKSLDLTELKSSRKHKKNLSIFEKKLSLNY